jgi:hypothetical protein
LIMSHLKTASEAEHMDADQTQTVGLYVDRLANSEKYGFERLVKKHIIRPELFLLSALEQQGWQRVSAMYALQRRANSIHDAHEYLTTHKELIEKIRNVIAHESIAPEYYPQDERNESAISSESHPTSVTERPSLDIAADFKKPMEPVMLDRQMATSDSRLPIPPPPPLPTNVPKPPPLPLAGLPPSSPGMSSKRLRSHLQWKEIHIDPLKQTIWSEILRDDSKVQRPSELRLPSTSPSSSESKVQQALDPWIDVKLFEDMFVIDKESDKKSLSPSSTLVQGKSTDSRPTLIDLHRANTILISLSRFEKRWTHKQLFEKIDRLDVADFTSDDVIPLIACLPTEDEIKNLAKFLPPNAAQDLIASGTAESFICEFSQLPENFKHAVHTFIFRLRIFDELDRVNHLIEQIRRELLRLRESHRLRILLKTVLKVVQLSTVEYGPSPRKSMKGFRLETLLRLKDVKSKDGKSTLMHYIAHILSRQHPEVLELPLEFESLSQLQNLNLREWKQSLMKLKNECENLNRTLSRTSDDSRLSHNERIRHEFISRAEQSIKETVYQWEAMYEEWKKTAEFFGEDVNQNMESFFDIFRQSLTSLGWAHKQNQENEAKITPSPKPKIDELSLTPTQLPTPSSAQGSPSIDVSEDWVCHECHKYLIDCDCNYNS